MQSLSMGIWMLLSDLNFLRTSTLEQDIPRHPPSTRYTTEQTTTTKARYPNKKKTRKFNDIQARKQRANEAMRLFRIIRRALPTLVPRRKAKLQELVRSHRPTLAKLRKQYRAKGETEENIRLIVTHVNYPHLPQVKISRKQMHTLLDVLDGKASKHSEYINNGFY